MSLQCHHNGQSHNDSNAIRQDGAKRLRPFPSTLVKNERDSQRAKRSIQCVGSPHLEHDNTCTDICDVCTPTSSSCSYIHKHKKGRSSVPYEEQRQGADDSPINGLLSCAAVCGPFVARNAVRHTPTTHTCTLPCASQYKMAPNKTIGVLACVLQWFTRALARLFAEVHK